jgi:hypothetical protein
MITKVKVHLAPDEFYRCPAWKSVVVAKKKSLEVSGGTAREATDTVSGVCDLITSVLSVVDGIEAQRVGVVLALHSLGCNAALRDPMRATVVTSAGSDIQIRSEAALNNVECVGNLQRIGRVCISWLIVTYIGCFAPRMFFWPYFVQE